MFDLMAVHQDDGPMPLYLHAVSRILREMRLEQQATGGSFEYDKFKEKLEECEMTPMQLGPLNMRLDMLESFMPGGGSARVGKKGGKEKEEKPLTKKQRKAMAKAESANAWDHQVGGDTLWKGAFGDGCDG